MLDLRFIRENPDLVRKAIQDKGDKADLDRLLALDVTRREIIGAVENARAQQNKVTQQIAEMPSETLKLGIRDGEQSPGCGSNA
mgnify:CR=1 FL=1